MKNSELIVKKGSRILKSHNISSSQLDAEILLSKVLNVERVKLLLKQFYLNKAQEKKFYDLISRRSKSEPVAYILKNREFYSLNFFVNKNTLIPRPETEIIVDKILKIYKGKKIKILDIGTGSGCIIISLLKNLKNSSGVGIDISREALNIAKMNSRILLKNQSNRIKLFNRSIENFETGRKFDLIISNPPYILSNSIRSLVRDIKDYEPKLALDGGKDGLDVIEKVIYKSTKLLKLNGSLAIEIGNKQYLSVKKILEKNKFRKTFILKDFKENIRCIIAKL